MKKITCLLIFIAIGSLVTFVGLSIADNFIYSLNNSSVITSDENNLKKDEKEKGLKIEEGASLVQYSYNNKYYTYLKEGKIYIYDTEKKELVDTIQEDEPICFYNLLYDKNQIIYFTEKKYSSSSKLTIETYEISSKNKMKHKSFVVANFVKIKELEGSPIINVKYINVETKSGSKESNIIYRVDLFGSISTVTSGKIINKLCMLKQKDKLYYEDNKNNIYYAGGMLSIFKEDVNIIGTDLDDNIYFLSSEKKNKVYKVQNNKIVDTIELSDTDVTSYYSDNTNVYLIYPTYIINISSKDPYSRVAKLSEYVTFESIKTDKVYLKTKDSIIISQDLLK